MLTFIIVLLQHSYQEITSLLSRNIKTPIKRYQHSYQEIIRLLSRDINTLINSNQEITRLPSRDYKTPIKRLQGSYQEITRLLSRDYKTPIKRLQYSYQEISAKHNKNDRILEFLSAMYPTRINFFPVHSNEKISHSLKNGRRYHNLR